MGQPGGRADRKIDPGRGAELGQAILVRKLDENGQETWRYSGEVLARGEEFVRLEAFFNREDMDFEGIRLKKNDRFVETFYQDRWYNVFEIHDREDDRLKAWYCNIGYPAEIEAQQVSYRDLALDLLVYPDGRQRVLDEDEFEALALPEGPRRQAQLALQVLQAEFAHQFA
jgi:hypothetical protein